MANEYGLNIANKDGTFRKYGANLELLNEARLDIDAWVNFLRHKGFQKIILQGHSLGTIKIVRYLFEGTWSQLISKLILLAPFDNIYLVESFTKGKWKEYLQIAKKKLEEGKGEELIPAEYFDAPMSYQTYVGWFEDNDFTKMFNFHDKLYSFPVLNKIKIPVKVIVGSEDEYFYTFNPNNPQEAIEIMKRNIKNFAYKLIDGATHSYLGCEDIVAEEVLKFVI